LGQAHGGGRQREGRGGLAKRQSLQKEKDNKGQFTEKKDYLRPFQSKKSDFRGGLYLKEGPKNGRKTCKKKGGSGLPIGKKRTKDVLVATITVKRRGHTKKG